MTYSVLDIFFDINAVHIPFTSFLSVHSAVSTECSLDKYTEARPAQLSVELGLQAEITEKRRKQQELKVRKRNRIKILGHVWIKFNAKFTYKLIGG